MNVLYHSAASSTHSRGRVLFFSKYPCRLATCREKKTPLCVRTDNQVTEEGKPGHTLISPSGIAPAKRLASRAISASSRRGTACADALRLEPGGFFCEVSMGEDEDEDSSDDDADGRDGKKHLKMPSACHLVALVKLIQTSMRPGLLRAGSRRSM